MHTEALHEASRPTLKEWYAKPAIEVLKSSEALGWEHIGVKYAQLYPALEEQPTPHTEKWGVIMVLRGVQRLRAWMPSEKRFDDLLYPGATQIVPPDLEASSSWEPVSTAAFIEFSPQLIYRLADGTFRGDPYHLRLPPTLNLRDPLIQSLIETLCSELDSQSALGSLYAESIAQTMVLHLLKKYANGMALSGLSDERRYRFTVQQRYLIDEYIDDHLCEKISLSDMADLLHISVSHFERIFRASFGRPPYQYVIERRVERAKQLLSRPYISLHDVARICGFANQSHLTRHFKRFVGVTPARFTRYSTH